VYETYTDSTDLSVWVVVEPAKIARTVRFYKHGVVRYEDALLELVNTYVEDGVEPDTALEYARERLS
jgi:hypothetical protein